MAATARAERATRSWLERLPVAPATVALAGVMLLAAVLLLYAGRHLTFYFDEWTFILKRRGGSVGTYLDPHNAHLVLFSVVVYKLLFVIVGLHHYWPYQAALVALHLLCAGLLYALIRPRLGPWLALAPVTLLLFMGTAFQDLLWPFQIALLVPVAGGLGALLLVQRRTHRADAGASALLILSLSGSGAGVPFVLGTGAVLIYQRSNWRRFWVVALPLALFVIWYLGWGTSERITSDSVLGIPQYVA